LQRIKDTHALNHLSAEDKHNIISSAKFICIAERMETISYNDEKYKHILRQQRSEERMLSLSTGEGRGGVGSLQHLTGHESNVLPIHEEVEELIQKKNPKKTKYSSTDSY
jgi:hypothetical protein